MPIPFVRLDASILPSFATRNSKELTAMQAVPRFRIPSVLQDTLRPVLFLCSGGKNLLSFTK